MDKKPKAPEAAVTIQAKDPRLAHVIAGAAAGAAKAYLELDKRDFKRPSIDDEEHDEPDSDEAGGPSDGDDDNAKPEGMAKRKPTPIGQMLDDDRQDTRAKTGKK